MPHKLSPSVAQICLRVSSGSVTGMLGAVSLPPPLQLPNQVALSAANDPPGEHNYTLLVMAAVGEGTLSFSVPDPIRSVSNSPVVLLTSRSVLTFDNLGKEIEFTVLLCFWLS